MKLKESRKDVSKIYEYIPLYFRCIFSYTCLEGVKVILSLYSEKNKTLTLFRDLYLSEYQMLQKKSIKI